MKKIFISCERLEKLQWNFQEKLSYDKLKTCKKSRALSPLYKTL